MKSQFDELRALLLEWGEDKYLPILEKNSQLENENYRLREQNARLKRKNNRLEDMLQGRNSIAPEEGTTIYAVFDRKEKEKLLVIGTIQECSELLGISVGHLRLCARPSGQKRNFKYKVVKLGKLD